jgi:hypothetical protein
MSTQPPSVAESEITGVVKMVCRRGVPFVVVIPDEDSPLTDKLQGEDITFTLSIWPDRAEPQSGQLVVLSEIREFDKGWRAMSARPICLSR